MARRSLSVTAAANADTSAGSTFDCAHTTGVRLRTAINPARIRMRGTIAVRGSHHESGPYYHRSPVDPLLDGEIDRIARGVIRRELAGSNAAAGHIEDLLADVRMRLIARLQHGRTPAEAGIDDLPSYTA